MILFQRYKKNGVTLKDSCVVLNSYDGAIHENTEKKRTHIISFSSRLPSESYTKIYAGGSKEILTWQQMLGEEKVEYIFPALDPMYRRIKNMRGEELYISMVEICKLSVYELHDGKMRYLRTQHSLWNRKHRPFLICNCKRSEGVTNPEHECSLISNDETLILWDRSLKRWTRKGENMRSEQTIYKNIAHMDWLDEYNQGISHFGIHPNLLRRDHLRLDVFHMRCAITRRLMTYLRVFVLGTSTELIE